MRDLMQAAAFRRGVKKGLLTIFVVLFILLFLWSAVSGMRTWDVML